MNRKPPSRHVVFQGNGVEMRKLVSAVVISVALGLGGAPAWSATAPSSADQELIVKKKRLAALKDAAKKEEAAIAKAEADAKAKAKTSQAADKTKLKAKAKQDVASKPDRNGVRIVKSTRTSDPQLTGSMSASVKPRRACGSFLQCLFAKRDRQNTQSRGQRPVQLASIDPNAVGDGISGKSMRETVDWNESKYKPGSIIVRTPERALYYVLPGGEAIRYSVGVGREGMQWSGNSKIVAKQEWPSWTPPQVMIEREAAKGHMIPPFMEGGPGNPLGARAMYIGGTMFRVHGTNNEASIGGAVSSGCIRMMNADVIDLYNRVKVGSPIYVYQ